MYRSGRRWGDEIKRGMGDVDLDVDADTSKARQEVKRLDRDIDRKRTVKIEHDKTSFGALATATRNIEQNFKAVAIAGLALPNTIANVSASVVQLSGVAGLLPAVVGGAALAIGSLKVATLGFGDAMKNVRDVDKFNESVAQLAPNMQQLAGAIRTALPELDRLKFTVGDAFGAGLGQQFTQLSTVYLPMFQTVMSQMAASANTALTTVSQMFQQPAAAGDVSAMTGNMASAFNILSQALAPVVKAFVDIGLVGSGFLPQLAAAATQAANQFAMFIDKARATGDLQQWIQGGIDAMSTLGRIAGDIFNIFMKFAGFDTQGGGLLGMIEGITSTVSDFVNSPAGQGMLQSFITQVGATSAAILPVLGSLLQALAPVMGIFGQISGTIIQSLAPAFDAWLQAMAPVIQQVMGALQPVLANLAPVLSQVANMLATQMISGIEQILPVLIPFVQQMGALLVAVLPMVPPLVQLAMSAIPMFQQALALILPVLTKFAEFLTVIATASIPQLITMVGALAEGFTLQFNTIHNVVQTVVGLVGPLIDVLTDKIQRFLDGPVGKLMGFLAGPIPRTLGLAAGALPSGGGGGGAPGAPFPSAAAPGGGGRFSDRAYGTPTPSIAGLPAPYTPPVSPYIAPLPASGGGGGGSGGATPSTVSPTGTDWEKVAQGESKGNWAINTGNGYYGGLQFDLPTWKEFGGTEFAERPDLASKEEQIAVAERVPPAQRPNRWPNTYAAGAVGRPPAGSTASAVSSGYPDTSGYSASAAPQDPRSFAHDVMMPYWQQQGLTVGDHEADQFGEHQHGALDIMVPDIATGNQVLQQVLSDPNVYGAIFNSQSYGYGHGAAGKPYGGANPHTDHVHAWYKPGAGGNITPPGAAGYPTDMGGYGGGFDTTDYTGYKGTREAQQRVGDTEARIAAEQSKLDALRMKPGATADDIAAQERKVAVAKREHRDALEDLTAAQNKYNDAAGKSPDAQGGAGDFGKDFMGGILEFFGFDGSLFKNPAEFGLVKLLGGFSKLKPRGEGGAGLAPGDPGGGGSGLESFLTSIIPQPFGPVQPGGSNSAPGQFFPNMPGSDSGGVLGRAFAPAGAPGPGNAIDNSITINNPVGQDHLKDTFQQAQSEQYPRMRQPLRSLP